MKRISTAVFLLILSFSAFAQNITPGSWRVTMDIGKGQELLFEWEISLKNGGYTFAIRNGAEKLQMDLPVIQGDSLFVRTQVFDSEFRGKIHSPTEISGFWHDYARRKGYRIAFTAVAGAEERRPATNIRLAETWEVRFSPGLPGEYPAVGVFEQKGAAVTGTFLTETGDYRYLDGFLKGDSLFLSTFDGAHAFHFAAKLDEEGILKGTFFSGNHYSELWTARPNPDAKLRDPDSLTFLKPGYERLAFSFPNPEGKRVSIEDEAYRGKVVIVQILGSWCPNCMDETRQLVKWHHKYQRKGLEVIGLAYERTGDSLRSVQSIVRMKQQLEVSYEVLLAATTLDKAVASASLPMLNRVMAYPTAIYIDRQGRVRKIYTGYYGPGTGAPHDEFVEKTERFLEKLLAE
ncbi:MAG: TlpA family protein disulfide reductase [Bacteroidetes bacterium]|nr:MAG: TlpA family protein disulfide reductase [Bacteroidota bacterium]